MNTKKAKALKKLLGIDSKQEKILQLKPNKDKKIGIISHTGEHRIEDRTTYSYVHGPKMRIYKDLKAAYKRKDAGLSSAILQYFFENREKIEEVEQQIKERADQEISDQTKETIELLSTLPDDKKEELEAKFKKSLRKYYKAELTDLSAQQIGLLMKEEETQTKQEGE